MQYVYELESCKSDAFVAIDIDAFVHKLIKKSIFFFLLFTESNLDYLFFSHWNNKKKCINIGYKLW